MRASAWALGIGTSMSLAACGLVPGNAAEHPEAPQVAAAAAPSPSASASATPPPAALTAFVGPTDELHSLFDRMRAAGAFRMRVRQSPDTYGSAPWLGYSIVFRFDPASWRQRTLDPSLVDDTIRNGADLYDNALLDCPSRVP